MARLTDSTAFEGALRSRSRATTVHFTVHHVEAARPEPLAPELSTTLPTTGASAVDELAVDASAPDMRWLGAVVPKRHARRSVTRSLLKRQIYGAAERYRTALASGIWVVRLRAPFDRTAFPSAASDALKASVRGELETLFLSAIAAAGARVSPVG